LFSLRKGFIEIFFSHANASIAARRVSGCRKIRNFLGRVSNSGVLVTVAGSAEREISSANRRIFSGDGRPGAMRTVRLAMRPPAPNHLLFGNWMAPALKPLPPTEPSK
jgi:hypothetical protein